MALSSEDWQQNSRAWDPDGVLDYAPETHRRVAWGQRYELLWPVFAWRITVPVGERPRLDPLQRAVLRLRLAGVIEQSELADHIGVDAALVEHLLDELRELSYLGPQGQVTDDGRWALDDVLPRPRSLRPGWVFQDAVGGRLWFQRFAPELRDDAGVEADEAGWPLVRRGTRGDPTVDPAIVVPALTPNFIRPSTSEVIDLLRRHRRDLRRLKRAGADLAPLLAPSGDRVESIADVPEAYHLHTFLYVPRDHLDLESQPWFVAEPFGFGASPELRELVQQVRRAEGPDSPLSRRLERIDSSRRERGQDLWQEMNDLLQEEAERHVDEAGLPVNADEVRRTLVECFLAVGRAQWGANRTPPPPLPTTEIASLARRSVELGLQHLHLQRGPGSAWQVLFRNDPKKGTWEQHGKALRRKTLEECAANVGLPRLPAAILSANANTVRACSERVDASNLRPKLAAFILAASSDAMHPFRHLADQHPDWIDRANDLATKAGDALHGRSRQRTTLQDVQGWAQTALNLCRELFAAMADAPQETTARG